MQDKKTSYELQVARCELRINTRYKMQGERSTPTLILPSSRGRRYNVQDVNLSRLYYMWGGVSRKKHVASYKLRGARCKIKRQVASCKYSNE